MGYDADIGELSRRGPAGEGGAVRCGRLDGDPGIRGRNPQYFRRSVLSCSGARASEHDAPEEFGQHTAEEYLFTFLRDLRSCAGMRSFRRLPCHKLRRAVAHYGARRPPSGPRAAGGAVSDLSGQQAHGGADRARCSACCRSRSITWASRPFAMSSESRSVELGAQLASDHRDTGSLSQLSTTLARELQYRLFRAARCSGAHHRRRPMAEGGGMLKELVRDPARRRSSGHALLALIALPHPLKGFLSRRLETPQKRPRT